MEKRLSLIALVLVFVLALTACDTINGFLCKHENVNEGNCVTDKTCADCGEVLRAAPGHNWQKATCETPKTCAGCGLTEGEALGHSWLDATTEAPKTCENCGVTEGERIITDERFTTAATMDYQGSWVAAFNMSGEMMGLTGFDSGIDCYLYLDLRSDGTASLRIGAADVAAMEADITDYLVLALYDELAATGLGKEDAEAAFQEAYGMSLQEYAEYAVKEMNMASLFEQMRIDMVYYVENGNLYMAEAWLADMGDPSPVRLDGENLILEEDLSVMGIEEDRLVFTRVAE